MKICTKCKINKSIDNFRKNKNYKNGRTAWCKDCCKQYRYDNRERYSLVKKAYNAKLKQAILNHYGNNCNCCGEQNSKFLTVDHINGGGCKHRKKLGLAAGNDFYNWLIKNNFPSGYQILCFNCNCGKSINGGICPHKGRNR